MCDFSIDDIPDGSLDYSDMYIGFNNYLKKMKPIIKVSNPPAPHSPFTILVGCDGQLWVVYKNEYGSIFHRLEEKLKSI